MATTGKEKTQAKLKIMKDFVPWLAARGFKKETSGLFLYQKGDALGKLTVNVPSFDSYYRLMVIYEPKEEGKKRFSGPLSGPYECPNHPGNKRYTFRFTHAEATWERCLTNMKEWIDEVALPWLNQASPKPWKNPNILNT